MSKQSNRANKINHAIRKEKYHHDRKLKFPFARGRKPLFDKWQQKQQQNGTRRVKTHTHTYTYKFTHNSNEVKQL